MILSDLGAEVIKLEKIGGEETRQSPPMVNGQSVYFSVYNRGKKSVCLDMRQEEGKAVFRDLLKTADFVLENFRPGTMAKMGLDYAQLCKIKPDIILLSASAFGQYGPYHERPGFDPIGQAMSGLMMLTGKPVGQPLGTASSIVDRYTALHLTIGALAALRHRDQTGEGQEIDVCLMDSALTMVEIPTSYYLPPARRVAKAGRPPYKAKDGWVIISGQLRTDEAGLANEIGRTAAAVARRPLPSISLRADKRSRSAGLVRRAHRGRDLHCARGGSRGGAGPVDSPGGEGSAHLGARDAGQDGRRGRRRDAPAGSDDQVLQDAGQARAGPDARPAHRRDPGRPARLRRQPDRAAPSSRRSLNPLDRDRLTGLRSSGDPLLLSGRPVRAHDTPTTRLLKRPLGPRSAIVGLAVGWPIQHHRRAQMVGHAGHNDARPEQQRRLDPQRGLVVQQVLPPVARHELRAGRPSASSSGRARAPRRCRPAAARPASDRATR